MDNQKLLISLQKLALVLTSTVGKDLEKREVNQSEFLILSHLNTKGRTKTQTLAEITMVTSGGITYHIKKLLNKEFIVKRQDLDDKRVFWIEITDLGRIYLQESLKGHNEYVDSLFSAFSEQEKEEFLRTIVTFGKKIKESGEKIETKTF